jgi:hypothetical protein
MIRTGLIATPTPDVGISLIPVLAGCGSRRRRDPASVTSGPSDPVLFAVDDDAVDDDHAEGENAEGPPRRPAGGGPRRRDRGAIRLAKAKEWGPGRAILHS